MSEGKQRFDTSNILYREIQQYKLKKTIDETCLKNGENA